MACADPRAADVCNVFPTGSIRDGAEIEAKVPTQFFCFFGVSNSQAAGHGKTGWAVLQRCLGLCFFQLSQVA